MPASGDLLDGLADLLVASGIATGVYSTSGVSDQVNLRRDFGPAVTYLVLAQTGGESFPWAFKEETAFQVLVDGPTLSGARAVARQVYDFLHERLRWEVSGTGYQQRALFIRAVAPPQTIPIGPGAGAVERFQFSTNFSALVVRDW